MLSPGGTVLLTSFGGDLFCRVHQQLGHDHLSSSDRHLSPLETPPLSTAALSLKAWSPPTRPIYSQYVMGKNLLFTQALILTRDCSPQPRSSSRAGPRGKVGELVRLGGPRGKVGDGLSGELDLEERPEERADDFEESLKNSLFGGVLLRKIRGSAPGQMVKSD